MHEGHHADLDDLVAAVVETGRLDADDDRDELAGRGPVPHKRLVLLQRRLAHSSRSNFAWWPANHTLN